MKAGSSQRKKPTRKAGRAEALADETCAKEATMLASKNRLTRNPYFHFHPFHTVFAFLGSLIVFALLVWFLAVPAR